MDENDAIISIRPTPKPTVGASSTADHYFSNYKIGSVGDDGRTIVSIVSQTEDYIIYRTDRGKVGFDATREFLQNRRKIVEKFDDVSTSITYSLPKRHHDFLNERIGYSLANSFSMPCGDERCFSHVESCIENIADDEFQLYYVMSGFFVFVIYGVLFLTAHIFSLNQIDYFQCAFMGSMGAFISVISRSRKLKASGFLSRRYSVVQGLLRTEIGALFGVLGFILVKSNVVLGMLGSNPYHILLISAFAGFNERYVPEAMKYAKE